MKPILYSETRVAEIALKEFVLHTRSLRACWATDGSTVLNPKTLNPKTSNPKL